MKKAEDLKRLLYQIDRKSYPAYKDARGAYEFPSYILSIDHVQGDPFASPSKVSIKVSKDRAGFPKELYDESYKRIALQDHLLRLFGRQAERYAFKAKGSGKSGLLSVSRCGQEIIERTALGIDKNNGSLLLCMEIGFPANGRSINAGELVKILFDFLPECVSSGLFYKNLDKEAVRKTMELSVDQQYIRDKIKELGLCAFVGNGSILPRESGVSLRPMKEGVPFISPASMEVTLDLPYHGPVKGMGIKKGVTLIVGGGYHGKSTLLKALETGVYNHIAGDGREYVITDETAVKVRAEDGRSIKNSDISMFINNLPNGKDTRAFYTEDASGSTSQAANVAEGMEAGGGLLLMDEDTSATNFMIRDELMQRVVSREAEPITPFIERVRALYENHGISSIIVAGSSGAYFHIADAILQMDHYEPEEITGYAKDAAREFPLSHPAAPPFVLPQFKRYPKENRTWKENYRAKVKVLSKNEVDLNRDTVDLRYVEQLADREQTAALGYMVRYAEANLCNGKKSLREIVEELMEIVEREGLGFITEGGYVSMGLSMPRKQEIFACFNRYRGLRL